MHIHSYMSFQYEQDLFSGFPDLSSSRQAISVQTWLHCIVSRILRTVIHNIMYNLSIPNLITHNPVGSCAAFDSGAQPGGYLNCRTARDSQFVIWTATYSITPFKKSCTISCTCTRSKCVFSTLVAEKMRDDFSFSADSKVEVGRDNCHKIENHDVQQKQLHVVFSRFSRCGD